MRKTLLFLSIFAATLVFTSCGGSKKASSNDYEKNPFGEIYKLPCEIYDTDTDFAATGIFKGSMNQKGEVLKNAIQNAQEQVRMKIKHAYLGMVSDYSQTIGDDMGNEIQRKVTMAGDQIIDAIVNDTKVVCQRFGEVDESGHIECYVGIKISKDDLSAQVAQAISNELDEDEKLKIGFNEMKYREYMKEYFEKYVEIK